MRDWSSPTGRCASASSWLRGSQRWFGAARAAYGAVLLARPGVVLRPIGDEPTDRRSHRVARLLGLRQLAQAGATAGRPGAAVLVVGAEVDLAHVVSMLALAAVDHRRSRLALLDAGVAAGWVACGVLAARHTPSRQHDPIARPAVTSWVGRNRDRLAARIVARTVPTTLRPKSDQPGIG